MKDKKLRVYIYYMLLTGLSFVVFFSVMFLLLGGVWGKLALGTLLYLPPARLVTEIFGFSKTKNYGFALISVILLVMLFLGYTYESIGH
ncbi:MAG: hypothetical protein LBI01_00080 [Elusimicrobium sp.]|jgi:hypothetical protein|nr:hypothetical protein [Elusimicrobium sp.]